MTTPCDHRYAEILGGGAVVVRCPTCGMELTRAQAGLAEVYRRKMRRRRERAERRPWA